MWNIWCKYHKNYELCISDSVTMRTKGKWNLVDLSWRRMRGFIKTWLDVWQKKKFNWSVSLRFLDWIWNFFEESDESFQWHTSQLHHCSHVIFTQKCCVSLSARYLFLIWTRLYIKERNKNKAKWRKILKILFCEKWKIY